MISATFLKLNIVQSQQKSKDYSTNHSISTEYTKPIPIYNILFDI